MNVMYVELSFDCTKFEKADLNRPHELMYAELSFVLVKRHTLIHTDERPHVSCTWSLISI